MKPHENDKRDLIRTGEVWVVAIKALPVHIHASFSCRPAIVYARCGYKPKTFKAYDTWEWYAREW